MTGKVYETIRQLFAAQNGATLASIVSYSGLPKQHVLKVLTANKGLFQYKPGTSKIIRLYSNRASDALKAAKESGQFYWEEKINYGAATIWCFPQGKNPSADKFRMPYTCGGLGDSYEVFVVLKTDENEAKLRSVGMKRLDEADLSKFPGYVEWTEDVAIKPKVVMTRDRILYIIATIQRAVSLGGPESMLSEVVRQQDSGITVEEINAVWDMTVGQIFGEPTEKTPW